VTFCPFRVFSIHIKWLSADILRTSQWNSWWLCIIVPQLAVLPVDGGAGRVRRFYPFSQGQRGCVGRGLAAMNYTAAAAVLLGTFHFRLADDVRCPLPTPPLHQCSVHSLCEALTEGGTHHNGCFTSPCCGCMLFGSTVNL